MQFNSARVMKIDITNGDILWEVRDTGIALTYGQSLNIMEGITQSESGSIFAVVYTYKSANVYEGLLLKVTPDGCIDTLCTTTAIEDDIRLQVEKMVVYPNPARDEVTLEVSREVPSCSIITIYTLQGVEMHRGRLDGSKHRIDVSGWPAGSYIARLMVSGSNTTLVKKMIKLE